MFKAWGWYRDSPGTAMKHMLEPSFASRAVFRRNTVLSCSPGVFFKEKRPCILCQCYEFKALSFRGTVFLYILVPAEARLTFPGGRRSTASCLGIFDPAPAMRCGHGRRGSSSGVLLSVGWDEQRESLACVAQSVVISIGVVHARFSYFIAVCSQLFSSHPVILNVYVPSVLLSILPRHGEGGGREKGRRGEGK